MSGKVTESMFQLNVLGPIALTRAALPFLLSRGHCRIVVVSSMAAVVPAPGQAVYSGTKLALHGYFATLQSELNDRCSPCHEWSTSRRCFQPRVSAPPHTTKGFCCTKHGCFP